MHDYGKIAFLDLHKTGSTFVSEFLRNCCTLPEVRFSKHDWAGDDYRSDCVYFISIRNPVDLYSSLYRFGLDRKGGVYKRLKARDLLAHYESFDTFVRLLLLPENSQVLADGYTAQVAAEMGFMSFRFLRLSLRYPMKQIEQQLRRGRPLAELEKNFITSHELKNETLNADLTNFATVLYPQYFDAAAVEAFLTAPKRINPSRTSSTAVPPPSDELMKVLLAKEGLLLKRYGQTAA